MYKKILVMIIVISMLSTIVAGCGSSGGNTDAEKTSEITNTSAGETEKAEMADLTEKYKISISSIYLSEGSDYSQDPLMKHFEEKFNVEVEPVPISWADWLNKTKIWVTSGDLPDITFWDFMSYTDYSNYTKQGLIRALPDKYETKYPNLARVVDMSSITKFIEEKNGGKLYIIPKVTYFNKPAEILTPHPSIYYRKDWAAKVGISVGDTISVSQLEQLAKAFVEKDPGGNGQGNTIGLASSPNYIMQLYINNATDEYTTGYKMLYKKDGKYQWGAADPRTLEGLKNLKKAYDEKAINKDFFTAKAETDYTQLFYAGKTGIILHAMPYGYIPSVHAQFGAANPGINANESIGIATYVNNSDGRYHGFEMQNYWSACIFNPKIDDEKMDRIMMLLDYVSTQEAQDLINLGFEGKDYTKSGSDITITREKDTNGSFKDMGALYPSYYMWALLVILWDNFGPVNPAVPQTFRDLGTRHYQIRSQGVLQRLDFELATFSAPNYDKFAIDYNGEFTQLLFDDGDLEQNWNKWVESKKAIVEPALKEVNDSLAK